MLQTVLRDIGIGDTEKIVFRSCVEKSPSVIAIEQDQPPPTEDDDVPF